MLSPPSRTLSASSSPRKIPGHILEATANLPLEHYPVCWSRRSGTYKRYSVTKRNDILHTATIWPAHFIRRPASTIRHRPPATLPRLGHCSTPPPPYLSNPELRECNAPLAERLLVVRFQAPYLIPSEMYAGLCLPPWRAVVSSCLDTIPGMPGRNNVSNSVAKTIAGSYLGYDFESNPREFTDGMVPHAAFFCCYHFHNSRFL